MIAPRNPEPARGFRGVNVIVRRDGSEVHLDDIETADQGQALLDEIDAAILSIEDQFAYGGHPDRDSSWKIRAETALKKRRRVRPALQKRIADLRRAERQAGPVREVRATPAADLRRAAFINAAEAMLERDLFVEIWARAETMEPAAFEGREGVRS